MKRTTFESKPSARELLIALAVVAGVELLSFGIFVPRLGFYHDDWVLLEMWTRTGSFLSFTKAFYAFGFGVRPLSMVHYWALFALGGRSPIPPHLFLLLGEIAAGTLYFALLRRLVGKEVALTAAALATAFPSHAVTHFWMSTSLQIVSIDIALAGLLAHVDWMETGRRRRLALSLSAYAAAMFYYEAPAFLPLLLAAGLWIRKRSLREIAAALWPFGVILGVAAIWQRRIFPWTVHAAAARATSFSPWHLVDVFRAGLGCVSYRIAVLCVKTAGPALRDFSPGLIAAWAAATVLLSAAVWRLMPRGRPRSFGPAAAVAAAGFVAANLPYAFARDYVPTYSGVMARTSAMGGLVGGLLAACMIAALAPRRALQGAAIALIFAASTWTSWHTALEWERAWSIENSILAKAGERATTLPRNAMVLLDGFPYTLNRDLDEVTVFDADWDISAALRLRTGRADLKADVVTPRTRFDKDAVLVTTDGVTSKVSGYDNLYVFHYDDDRWHDYPPRPR